jgi:hypothetical protein
MKSEEWEINKTHFQCTDQPRICRKILFDGATRLPESIRTLAILQLKRHFLTPYISINNLF